MRKTEDIISDINKVNIDKCDINSAYIKLKDLYDEAIKSCNSEIKHTHIPAGIPFFRARFIPKNLLFKHPSELSTPPKHLTNFGRLNIIRVPVFYSAESVSTSVLEMKPKKGDRISVTENVLLTNILTAVFGNNDRYTDSAPASQNLKTFYDHVTDKISQKVDPSESHKYIHTATLGHLLFTDKNYQGVIYPSYYSENKADNFALRQEDVENCLQFVCIRHFKVVEVISEFSLKIKCIAKSDKINPYGQFLWEKIDNCLTHDINSNNHIRTLKDL